MIFLSSLRCLKSYLYMYTVQLLCSQDSHIIRNSQESGMVLSFRPQMFPEILQYTWTACVPLIKLWLWHIQLFYLCSHTRCNHGCFMQPLSPENVCRARGAKMQCLGDDRSYMQVLLSLSLSITGRTECSPVCLQWQAEQSVLQSASSSMWPETGANAYFMSQWPRVWAHWGVLQQPTLLLVACPYAKRRTSGSIPSCPCPGSN